MIRRRGRLKLILAAALAVATAVAGFGVAPAVGQSGPGVPLTYTVQAINQARVVTRILYITAHPDDEDPGLLAYLSRGLYADVALLTITRGQGGQNAVGPEQDGPLGVIRTTELLAAGREYGVQQFFTRAVDTGFSKSPEWTMKIWGDQLPMEDMVRAIRTYRPQVVINGWGGIHNGHGQHQASGLLAPQAVAEAADPTKFPEQLREGLIAWKVPLEVRPAGFNFGPAAPPTTGAPTARSEAAAGSRGRTPAPGVPMPTTDISPLWGMSYVEMGAEGRSQQPSQGTPTVFGAGGRRQSDLVVEKGDSGDGIFDPKLLHESISDLATHFPSLQSMMAPPLVAADRALADASNQSLALDRTAAARSLAEAGKQVATLREQVAKQNGEDTSEALYEIDQVRERIDRALADVVSLSIAVNADRHELVAGETFSVSVSFPDKPAVAVDYPGNSAAPGSLNQTAISFECRLPLTFVPAASPRPNSGYHFGFSVPADAVTPSTPGDAILPFPPPLVTLIVPVALDGYTFHVKREVEFSETKTTGINTYALVLVPAVTLTVQPPEIMVPAKHAAAPIKLFARIRYHGTQPAKVAVGLDAPKGWSVEPVDALDFSAPGDQLVRYLITPPAGLAAGAYPLHPYAKIGDETFRTSLEAIPTLPTRDWSNPDDAAVHVLNLNVPAGLHVGYIAGDNDPLPETLRQIGIQVDMIDEIALAFGDLSHYDAIVVGIRGYELRPDLPSDNSRLLDYVKNGGTLLVQYQREPIWNKYKPGPYPAAMANTAARTTDPNSPVEFLAPQNPLLNTPNKITPDDFKGWIQERGTYYWDTWDSHYTPILGLQDPGEPVVKGSLMYARYGKGVYIYAGPVFFRELPAGVPGAYRLFVNLLSQTPHVPGRQ